MARGIFTKRNGTWVEVLKPQVQTNAGWKNIQKGYNKVDGVWRQFFPSTGSVTYSTPGISTFNVPAGIYSLTVIAAGGGGGGGGTDSPYGGSSGYPGRYISGQLSVNPGDTITIGVGGGGSNGSSGTGSGAGGGGSNSFTPFSTLNLLSNSNNLRVTNGAYVGFLNSYGVWNYNSDYPTFDQTVTINFPFTGYYTIEGSVDNAGQIYVDGIQVLSMPGEFGYRSTFSNQFFVSAGNHTVNIQGQNWGGPGSIGFVINGGFNGGRGGEPGTSGWSGGGGGGGAASILLLNGSIAAVAGGGGGGGGGGNWSAGKGQYYPGYGSAGQTAGGDGQDKGGDGGGGGGGGGGYQGGAGGPVYGGDDGAYAGQTGGSWPSGFHVTDNPAGGGGGGGGSVTYTRVGYMYSNFENESGYPSYVASTIGGYYNAIKNRKPEYDGLCYWCSLYQAGSSFSSIYNGIVAAPEERHTSFVDGGNIGNLVDRSDTLIPQYGPSPTAGAPGYVTISW